MRRLTRVHFCLFALFGGFVSVNAQQVYVATGSNGTPGTLFTFDTTTGTQTSSHTLTVAGDPTKPIGLTGIAFNPLSGTLFGVTVRKTDFGLDRSLVMIDPNTGNVTVIGALGTVVSDIAFTSSGALYGFTGQSAATHSLLSINPMTGAVTAIGDTGLSATYGGGLAISRSGTFFLSATGAADRTASLTDHQGTLDALNPTTGARTQGPQLTGASFSPVEDINTVANPAFGALAFDNNGVLWGSYGDSGSPSTVVLGTINIISGTITNHFFLPGNTDAIAFQPNVIPEPSTITLLVLGVTGAAALGIYRRRS
jgi:hypothetical protein